MSTAEINAIKENFVYRFLAIDNIDRLTKMVNYLNETESMEEEPWPWVGPKTLSEAKERIRLAMINIANGNTVSNEDAMARIDKMIAEYEG